MRYISGGKISSGTMQPPSAASTSPRNTPMAPACDALCSTAPITIAAPVAASANSSTTRAVVSRFPQSTRKSSTVPTTISSPCTSAIAYRPSASPSRIVRTDVGEASMREVTPRRRVSISIAEADSDVRNMNRISSCAAPVWNVPTVSAPAVRVVTSMPGSEPAALAARSRPSSKSSTAPSATANRAARTSTLCASTTASSVVSSSWPAPVGTADHGDRHGLARADTLVVAGGDHDPPFDLAPLDRGAQRVRVGEGLDLDAVGRLEPRAEVAPEGLRVEGDEPDPRRERPSRTRRRAPG